MCACIPGLGSKSIEFSQVLKALLDSNDSSFAALVVRERIPRTIFSIMAGASLEFQEPLCNP